MQVQDETRKNNLETVRRLGAQVRQGKDLTYTFEADYTNDREEHFTGEITFHRPSMGDYMKMGALKAKYLSQQFAPGEQIPPFEYIDDLIKIVAQQVSTLMVVVDKCPEWLLRPEEITDIGLVAYVHRRYLDWIDGFRTDSGKQSEGDSESAE